jgi:hypothetical protein
VGKPCDINALKNLGKYDPRVEKYCKYTMTISCGMFPDLHMYTDWLKEVNIREEDIVEFRYRGEGCPGWSPFVSARKSVDEKKSGEGDYAGNSTSAGGNENRNENGDGGSNANPDTNPNSGNSNTLRTAHYSYTKWFYERPWRCQLRCKVCPDFLGEEADITVMDCWHEAMPKGEGPGFVLVVSRTEKGEGLVQRAFRDNYLTMERTDGKEGVRYGRVDGKKNDNQSSCSGEGKKRNKSSRETEKCSSDKEVGDGEEVGRSSETSGETVTSDLHYANASYTDIARTQPHQMTRKIGTVARQIALMAEGVLDRICPEKMLDKKLVEQFSVSSTTIISSLSRAWRMAVRNFEIVKHIKPGAGGGQASVNETQQSQAKEKESSENLTANLTDNDETDFLKTSVVGVALREAIAKIAANNQDHRQILVNSVLNSVATDVIGKSLSDGSCGIQLQKVAAASEMGFLDTFMRNNLEGTRKRIPNGREIVHDTENSTGVAVYASTMA